MAGLTNQITTELAAYGAGVAGIRASSGVPVDTIPASPFVFAGPPRYAQTGGSWEVLIYHVPLTFVVQRTGSEDRDQTIINDLMDLVRAYFRTGIGLTLSALGVVSAEIQTADTNKFASYGSAEYQGVEFDVMVTVMSGQTYTS